MNKYFKRFRETGKIADYLKYRYELAKEEKIEVKKNENSKNKGASNKKS